MKAKDGQAYYAKAVSYTSTIFNLLCLGCKLHKYNIYEIDQDYWLVSSHFTLTLPIDKNRV